MNKVPAVVTFKTKVKTMLCSDGAHVPYIDYKREVSRHDCNLKPHQHDYYNSDLFPSMLQGAYDKAIGGKYWVRLAQLPEGVTIDTSKFLAVITVRVSV